MSNKYDEFLKAEEGWKGEPAVCMKHCPYGYRNYTVFDGYDIKVPYCTPDICIYAPTTKMVRLKIFDKLQQWTGQYSYSESIEFLEYQPNTTSNTDLLMTPSMGWNGHVDMCVRTYFYLTQYPKTKFLCKYTYDKDWHHTGEEYHIYQGKRHCGKVDSTTLLAGIMEAWLDNPCVQVTHEKRRGRNTRRYITLAWDDVKWLVGVTGFPKGFTYLNERLFNTPRKSAIEASKELAKDKQLMK